MRHRDEDLGPAVTGFGADVPSFMLISARPARGARRIPIQEGEPEA
jgi:hypothetical protein